MHHRIRPAIGRLLLAGAGLLLTGCAVTPPGGNENANTNANDNTAEARWQLVLDELPAGLLSVSGTSASDVYAVGADTGDGMGPLAVHYDGQRWRRLATGATGDLWWITDRAVAGDFYMAGEGGLLLRYDPGTDTFTRFETPGTETLFGVWGTGAGDVLAVGGDINRPDDSGVIWRFDGDTWTAEDLSASHPNGVPLLFKIWGRGPGDIYVAGERGIVLLFDGAAWSTLPSGTTRTLFTIHGNDEIVAATGGRTSGVIVERFGPSIFIDATPLGSLQVNGVFVPAAGEAVAVGREGSVAFRRAAGWEIVDTGLGLDLLLDYHAAWIDPAGGVWAVGGNIVSEPQTDGVIVHFGATTIGTQFVP
jgi:hypothetical protein